MVCQQKQVLAFGSFVGKKQTVDFALSGLFRRNVVRHLDALKHSVAVTHNEIAFSGAVVEIINIPSLVLAFAYKVCQDNGFKAPTKVLA